MRLMSHPQGLMFKCLSENILFVVRGQRERLLGGQEERAQPRFAGEQEAIRQFGDTLLCLALSCWDFNNSRKLSWFTDGSFILTELLQLQKKQPVLSFHLLQSLKKYGTVWWAGPEDGFISSHIWQLSPRFSLLLVVHITSPTSPQPLNEVCRIC